MIIFRIVKKFGQILTRHQKMRIAELLVIMIIGGFLEMLSVSLVLPFMNAAMDPDATMQKNYVQVFCDLFHIESARTFLIAAAILLAASYIIKNVYLLIEYNILYAFTFNCMYLTQRELLHSYLNSSYERFLHISSGEVLRIVDDDTSQSFRLLQSVLSFFSEIIVMLALTTTIFLISPSITLGIAGIIAGMLLVILFIVKPILRRAGFQNQNAFANMNKWQLQSIQGIKEIKVMRKEDYFEEQFAKNERKYVAAQRKYNVLSMIPKFLLEAVGMSAIFIVIAVMIYQGVELKSLVPIIAAIAMAAVRLLPSANRISVAVTGAAYQEPMLDKLLEVLKELHSSDICFDVSEDDKIGLLKDQIFLSGVTYRYPEGETDILHDADLIIRKGQAVGIVGASGAGKTTAVDILLGLLHPQRGNVLIDGKDTASDIDGWLTQIGYVPQMIFLLDDTVRANVAFGVPEDEVDEEKVWKALEEAALADFVHNMSQGLDTELGERGIRLSGGQRQRIGIARALYHDPSILVLDEATSALDNETENEIMESINHLHGKKTMVIIAHRLTTIEGCDVVYKVEDGKISMEKPA